MNIESCFYLYHTSACHLCEEAETMVSPIAKQLGVSLILVDISDDDDLVDKYALRIPVLYSADTYAELGWPFSAEQAREFMQGQQCL